MPPSVDGSLSPIELLQQERRVVNGLAMNGGMTHDHAWFGHHLFKIAQAEAIGQVPPDAEQDHGSIKMPALEHHVPTTVTKVSVAETLKQRVCDGSWFKP